ncbi:ribosomal protection-like ABC-F family protein [Brevibacillus ginsengisoli]|uniref:ribosomal protection-like ABC-F family protein n=1 Tax=Brevibacillus ginsengisoli TaxID=363854 RepID=UPI003CF43D2D
MIVAGIQNVSKNYGYNPVLQQISFEVTSGERVGIVGPNGAGKTTLFRILCGMESADSGQIFRAKGSRWAYLPQTPVYPTGWTAEEVIRSAFHEATQISHKMRELEQQMSEETTPEQLEKCINQYQQLQETYEQLDGYQIETRIAQVTNGLGISAKMLATPFEQLSGGEKTKVGLAKILCEQSDVLLLDEPTNHLDVESMEWLESFLLDYQGAILVISHDRFFLDAVATVICEVDGGELEVYQGNYSSFVKEKEERLLRQFAQYEEQQKKIKQMKETIKRLKEWGNRSNPPNAGFHRRAKSMEKALERMEKIDRPKMENTRMGLQFHQTDRSGEEVVVLSGVTKSYGEKQLFQDADLLLRYGERKALLGPNGSGKSTLLKIVLNQVTPDQGKVKVGNSVKVGYLSQQALEGDPKRRVIDVLRETVLINEAEARHVLAKFMFYGEQVFKRLESLSGGERMRLRLAQLMHQDINLLILDEPTNHLDIDARETLEEAIADFRGSLFIVSHDRYFLQKIVDGVFWLQEGGITHYHGRYQEARAKYQQERKSPGDGAVKQQTKQSDKERPTAKESTPAMPLPAAEVPKETKETRRTNSFKLQQTEQQIAECESRREELHQLLHSDCNDYDQLQKWQQEVEECNQKIEELYDLWYQLQE